MIAALFNLFQQPAEGAGDIIRPKVPPSDSFWMPVDASVTARDIDILYDAMVWISVISAVGIFAAMFHFCTKYRAKSREANEKPEKSTEHNTTLEVTWSVAPMFVCVALFVLGFQGYVDHRTPPKDALHVSATGQKWKWIFNYDAGLVDDRLHVPVDRNVRIVIDSVDVLHSLFIPAFRVKMDAVPGRFTDLWFKATKPGTYPIVCAEYCGTAHSDMLTEVVVHEPGGYEKWVKEELERLENMDPVKLGELTYKQTGCAVCHSTDGTVKTGPSFKGLWGKTEALEGGGTAVVDENYVMESLLKPQAKIVQGFPPTMPVQNLSDKRVKGIIAYLKTLK